MSDDIPPPIRRADLEAFFAGNPRLIYAFERQSQAVAANTAAAGEAKDTASSIQVATVLTLTPNDVFENERVVQAGTGIVLSDEGGRLIIALDGDVPRIEGGANVTFYATAETVLALPDEGTVATTDDIKDYIASAHDFADDAAAAAGGVPVGGIYRTGSALKVRVA